jgi:hypothetical protein
MFSRSARPAAAVMASKPERIVKSQVTAVVQLCLAEIAYFVVYGLA